MSCSAPLLAHEGSARRLSRTSFMNFASPSLSSIGRGSQSLTCSSPALRDLEYFLWFVIGRETCLVGCTFGCIASHGSALYDLQRSAVGPICRARPDAAEVLA